MTTTAYRTTPPVLQAGAPLEQAAGAIILLHGRGGSAEDILALGRFIDIKIDVSAPVGRMGAGTVHHIAFRNTEDAAQAEWRKTLSRRLSVTPVQDRTYFHSIYFREPGGVLFEMATDDPGFLIDEPAESLGEALRLPRWYEPMRPAIEARLSPLTLHKASQATSLVGVSE